MKLKVFPVPVLESERIIGFRLVEEYGGITLQVTDADGKPIISGNLLYIFNGTDGTFHVRAASGISDNVPVAVRNDVISRRKLVVE